MAQPIGLTPILKKNGKKRLKTAKNGLTDRVNPYFGGTYAE